MVLYKHISLLLFRKNIVEQTNKQTNKQTKTKKNKQKQTKTNKNKQTNKQTNMNLDATNLQGISCQTRHGECKKLGESTSSGLDDVLEEIAKTEQALIMCPGEFFLGRL